MTRLLLTTAALVFAAACDAGRPVGTSTDAVSEAKVAHSRTAMAVASPPAPAPEGFVQSQSAADRKIIRNAQLRIELEDVARAVRSADSIATAVQGVLANSSRTLGADGATEANLTLRVPADRFAVALDALRSIGRVRMDNMSADDVTRSYNDLEIRIAVKREVVSRLRSLLANRTARLADLLAAERELGRAVAELEQMEGERRYLDNQIAMTTIQVTFFHAPVVGPRGFLDPIADAVRETLVVLGRSVAAVISVATVLAPWAVLLGVALWLRRIRRRRTVTADARS
jgi:hypothetical protein